MAHLVRSLIARAAAIPAACLQRGLMKRLHRLAASGCKHQVQAVAGLVLASACTIVAAMDPQKRNRRPLSPADEETAA